MAEALDFPEKVDQALDNISLIVGYFEAVSEAETGIGFHHCGTLGNMLHDAYETIREWIAGDLEEDEPTGKAE